MRAWDRRSSPSTGMEGTTTLGLAVAFGAGVISFLSPCVLPLGASASALGRVLLFARDWIARVGGALIIVFGLYLLGVFNLRALSTERRIHLANKPVGYLGSVLVGITFGAGWTPCIGPILGAILIYTSSTASLGRGL